MDVNPYAVSSTEESLDDHKPLSVLATLRKAQRIYAERFLTVCAVVLIFWGPAEFLSSYLAYEVLSTESLMTATLQEQGFEIFFGALACAAVSHISFASLQNRSMSIGEALVVALKSCPVMILNRIITYLLTFLGSLLFLLPGIYILIRTILVDTVTALEGKAGSLAVSRSYELTWSGLLYTFLMTGLALITIVIMAFAIVMPSVYFPDLDNMYVDAVLAIMFDLAIAYFHICYVVMWDDLRQVAD